MGLKSFLIISQPPKLLLFSQYRSFLSFVFLLHHEPIKMLTPLFFLFSSFIFSTYFNGKLPSVTLRAPGTINKDDKGESGRVNTICRLPDSVLLSYFVSLSKILSSRDYFWITARQLHHSHINMQRGERKKGEY